MSISSGLFWGAWQFTAPAMLGWAAAAAIPLIIHFLSRRRYRDMPWAAMQFLEAAWRKHARRWRLEQWLLLIIRMAMLLLLALALAEPLSHLEGQSPRAHTPRTLWLLVIDESYSMQYAGPEGSWWEEACRQARQLVSQAAQGDGFLLVAMGNPPRALISDVSFSKQDVLRELDGLTPRDTTADLGQTLLLVRQLLQRDAAARARWDQVRVVFWSDLQASTWNAVQQPDVRNTLSQLAERASLHLVETGSGSWRNAAVTQLRCASPVVTTAQEVQWVAEIRRFSADAIRGSQATWWVDGQRVAESPVDLATGSAVIVFSHRFTTPGTHTVTVRCENLDPLRTDNQRHSVVLVRDQLKVLVVEGTPGEGQFVALALQPEASEKAVILVETATAGALGEKRLEQYDAVFLLNVPSFSQEDVLRLRRYLGTGGGIIIALGDAVPLAHYNERLGDARDGEPLLPGRLLERIEGVPAILDPLGYQHPVAKPFEGRQRAGLLTVPIRTYARIQPFSGPNVRPVLGLQNGDPLLLERDFGRGRLLLLATSLGGTSALTTAAWNDWPAWPSFVPLIHEMVSHVVGRQSHLRTITVGEPLMEPLPVPATARTVAVVTPRDSVEHVPVEDSEHGPLCRYGETWWSGYYQIRPEQSSAAPTIYAVNVDPSEGELTRVNPQVLPSQFVYGWQQEPSGSSEQLAPASSTSWAKPLLAVVFGLLLMDNLLGWRFGTARSFPRTATG
jgi:hypothetical protein